MKKALGCLALTAAVMIPITVLATDDDDQSSQRSIFIDKEKEAVIQADQQKCSVIEPDIAKTVTLDVLKQWKYQSNDYGYPKALTSVCFLNYDNEAEYPLSILLEERNIDGQTRLAPPGGSVTTEGYSLWNSAEYYAKQVLRTVKEEDLQLLNAIHATNKDDTSKDKILHTSFAVFGPPKLNDPYNQRCELKWHRIKDEHTLISEYDGSVIDQSSLWYYTKELLISIYNFVNCPKHPVFKRVNPSLQWPVPTEEYTHKQVQLFNDRGCAVFGNEIVYKGKKGKEWEQKCRPALLQEMKRVCGKQFKADEAAKVSCIIHGASSDYNWKMPRRSSLPIEPELWTVAVLRSYIFDFGFGWLFGYAFSGGSNPQFGGMVAILAVDNLDGCEYQKQDGDSRLKADTDRSKAVIRYNYAQTFRGVKKSEVPDAWIYPSSAANNCGIRLLGQYYFRPASVDEPHFSIPDACSVTDLFDPEIQRAEQYKHEIAQQGFDEGYIIIYLFHWNEAEESLSWAIVKYEVEHTGHSIRYAAALHLQNLGLGAIRVNDIFWLGAYEEHKVLFGFVGVFLPELGEHIELDLAYFAWPQNQVLDKDFINMPLSCKQTSKIPAPYNQIPNGCILNRRFELSITEKKLEDWRYKTDDQGLGEKMTIWIQVLFWDDSDRLMYEARTVGQRRLISMSSTDLENSFIIGGSIRDTAANELKEIGLGDIKSTDLILAGGYWYRKEVFARIVIFLPRKDDIVGYEWIGKSNWQFDGLYCK